MKSLTLLLLAGLAVAAQEGGAEAAAGNATDVAQAGNATEAAQGGEANADAGKDNNNNNNNNSEDNNQDNNNQEDNNQDINANDVIQVQNGQQCVNLDALNDPNFDPASLNLGNMQVNGGLNLGSINLADPVSLAFGIDQLMNNFCLGQLVDLNTLLALGVQNQQQMFLELAQIAQLQQLGLVDVFGAQNLIQSQLLFGGGAGNVLNAGNILNVGGVFKREPGSKPATLRERRDDMIKRQCNVANAGQGQAASIQNLPPCQNENNNDQQNQDQQNAEEQAKAEEEAKAQEEQQNAEDQQNADEQNADEQNADEQNAGENADAAAGEKAA